MCFLENSSLFGKLSEIDGAAKILRVLCYYVINHEVSQPGLAGSEKRMLYPIIWMEHVIFI